MMKEIMVSICCLAYNHEKYIASALEGFVTQKTDFAFEVLVHDDASTDQTAAIIRDYECRYPNIIKPIYQVENQYSKKIRISQTYQYPRARGKYIALCEGDDCWIDPYKLQKQVDYMEANPACTLCFTNAKCDMGGKIRDHLVPWVKHNWRAYKGADANYDMGEMALLDYVPTASLLFKREDILNAPELSPGSFRGDTFIRLYLTSIGYAHCIDEDTCIYRFGVEGSLTTQWHENIAKSVAFLDSMSSLLDDMDHLTDRKYHSQIAQTKLWIEYKKRVKLKQYSAVRGGEFHKLFLNDGLSEYGKFVMQVYCPGLFAKMKEVKASFSVK